MTFPKYRKYKDSGAEWIGQVPAHWEADRLKWSVSSCKNGIWGDEPKGDGNDIRCVRVADFDRAKLVVNRDIPTFRNLSATEQGKYRLQPGDLLLEKSGGGDKQPVGCVVLFEHSIPSVYANFIARIRPAEGMYPSFWRYVHSAGYDIGLNIPSIKQTSGIQNLDQQSYLDELGPFPPYPEQKEIAAFLDYETARIDALIEEQQRLIELLKEKRQAVISHSVTKGLDSAVPMKDSGVEWLGEVPAHWARSKLKYLVNGIVDAEHKTAPLYESERYLVVRTSNVRSGHLILKDAGYTDRESFVTWTARGKPEPGDILMTREAPAGEACLVPEGVDLCLGQRMVLMKTDEEIASKEFILFSLYAGLAEEFIDSQSQGSTVTHLNMAEIEDIPLFEPPLSEQHAISEYVIQKLAVLDQLMNSARRSVELMKERRSALISAAVTGKIEVRNWQSETDAAKPLPMAAEEPATYEAREQ